MSPGSAVIWLLPLGGASIDPIVIPALVAVGALSAYLLVVAPLALPFVRRREGKAVGLHMLFPRIGLDAETATIAARVVATVAVAGFFSFLLGVRRAYWLMTVAGAVLQASQASQSTAVRAVHRILGTLCGAAVFGLIELAEPDGLWLVAVLAVLQFAIEVVVARSYALALTFITPAALMISAAGGMDAPLALASERIVDTFLGPLPWRCSRSAKRSGRQGGGCKRKRTFRSAPMAAVEIWIDRGGFEISEECREPGEGAFVRRRDRDPPSRAAAGRAHLACAVVGSRASRRPPTRSGAGPAAVETT